jgi:TldD protein
MGTRRDFLRHGGLALGAIAANPRLGAFPDALLPMASTVAAEPPDDATTKALMAAALGAARSAGASYADARISRQRQNFVFTREAQIQNVVDTDSVGCGVRVLVDGTWGFAATRVLTTDGVTATAREAVAIAKAGRIARDRPVELLPAPAYKDVVWKGAFTKDPFDVSVEEKADLLLRANAAALKVSGVKFVFSGLFFVKEERSFANTDGSVIAQTNVRSWPTMQITAVAPDFRTGATSPPRWGAAGSTWSSVTWSATRRGGPARPSRS